MTPEPNPEDHAAVSIAKDHVIVPPRASSLITVYCEDDAPEVDTMINGDKSLLQVSGVSVARGIACFKQYISHILETNSTEEYQHKNMGAEIAFLEEAQETSQVIVVANFERAREDSLKLPHPFDVNPALAQGNRKKRLDLLRGYSE